MPMAGARRIGSWFGTGPDRGMALLFIAAGLIGLTITLLAFRSRGYRELSSYYSEALRRRPGAPTSHRLTNRLRHSASGDHLRSGKAPEVTRCWP
ncbi:MAG: transporter [Propionibacteriaceae bacterium]|nr:transporter [Propionibacteriaceae bacterium]